jgi:hypothetical protein
MGKKNYSWKKSQGLGLVSDIKCECGRKKPESQAWCKRCSAKVARRNRAIIKSRNLDYILYK